jgi:hypothetical protein
MQAEMQMLVLAATRLVEHHSNLPVFVLRRDKLLQRDCKMRAFKSQWSL